MCWAGWATATLPWTCWSGWVNPVNFNEMHIRVAEEYDPDHVKIVTNEVQDKIEKKRAHRAVHPYPGP